MGAGPPGTLAKFKICPLSYAIPQEPERLEIFKTAAHPPPIHSPVDRRLPARPSAARPSARPPARRPSARPSTRPTPAVPAARPPGRMAAACPAGARADDGGR